MTILVTRRLLLRTGVGGLALGAVTVAAGCSGEDTAGGGSPGDSGGTSAPEGATASLAPAGGDGVTWSRVNLGFVSAYVLVRAGEAVVVDTGTTGSESAIEAILSSLGVGWADVTDDVLTHQHGDHIGSAEAVAQAAPDATFHAGVPDVPAIEIGREVSALQDGDRVRDLITVATPGHTPGHVCVHDTANSVLVAGDALIGTDGRAALPSKEFASDYDEALQSVELLAALDFETAYLGHGEPVLSGAAQQVRDLV